MGTGISRAVLGIAVLTVGLAGCGGGGAGSAFSWLHPQSPPAAWKVVTIPTGARMAYPAAWSRQHSDAGTATAVLPGADGSYLGYVNVTPRQGAETFSNWASFRVEHNAEEGDLGVKRLAAVRGLRFLSGRGSCVKDTYATKIGARYVEIACLVGGSRGDTVIVAAASAKAWATESGTLERAIEGLRT
jgi:hypothetical protein